jgi:sugar phosphate isomerase/epimerase
MKIGTTLYSYTHHFPIEEAAPMLALDGFNAVDYSVLCNTEGKLYTQNENWMEQTLLREKSVLDENGVAVSQIHGPWRYPPMDGSAFERNNWLMLMQRSVRAAAYLGSPYVVVHPLMPFGANSAENPGFVIDCNAEHYARLCDYAKDYRITVCLENMPFPLLPLAHVEQVRDFVDALGRKNLKVCLDTGHANICEMRSADAVRILGDRLAVLHIHDNGGTGDDHLTPLAGTIDFSAFAAALHEIGFDGSLSSEAKTLYNLPTSKFRAEGRKIAKILKKMAENKL